MSSTTPESSRFSANADKKAAVSLADLLEARSREYLQHCLKTSTSAERHTVWSRLYAVTQRLRLAVLAGGESGVADAVIEIGSNLLGCEEMAVLELDTEYRDLSVVASVGLTAVQRSTLKSQARKISVEINRGQVRIVDKRLAGDEFLASVGITALVPLTQGHSTEGAIIFFNLLPQRKGFDSRDRELLGLLAAYGPSLFGLQRSTARVR
jgi:hypothetical protein